MTTEQRATTRHGWVRCPGCGRQFLREHNCTRPLGEVVDRRPAGFEEQVAQARAEARAAQAAGEQLALTDLRPQCRGCGRDDVALSIDGDCGSCMARAALAAADALEAATDQVEPGRAPP